jgi:hypothetical protein
MGRDPKLVVYAADSRKMMAYLIGTGLSGATPKPHLCEQCGEDMGYEWLLGAVCGACCRKNHRRVTRRGK